MRISTMLKHQKQLMKEGKMTPEDYQQPPPMDSHVNRV
jgi:hypothetical protein